jgi:hypothetical protein
MAVSCQCIDYTLQIQTEWTHQSPVFKGEQKLTKDLLSSAMGCIPSHQHHGHHDSRRRSYSHRSHHHHHRSRRSPSRKTTTYILPTTPQYYQPAATTAYPNYYPTARFASPYYSYYGNRYQPQQQVRFI